MIGILAAAESSGLTPMATAPLHTLAYFADALSPVWGLRIVDAYQLKRASGPLAPPLQEDVDLLVGQGVIAVEDVRHVTDGNGLWRLEAKYRLNAELAAPIIAQVQEFPQQTSELAFVREVVLAVSGLTPAGILDAPRSDAAYSDVLVDPGGVVALESPISQETNRTARVALRFSELAPDLSLAPAELIHLYVRALFQRL